MVRSGFTHVGATAIGRQFENRSDLGPFPIIGYLILFNNQVITFLTMTGLFLGFGFHAQNLSLLQLDQPNEGHVIATVKKINMANRDDLRNAVARTLRIGGTEIELFDMTAPELLSELRLKIMMRAGT
jgi:hypothetical protein